MAKDYFSPMHTAEHILNQTMVRKFSCQRSFSNHIEKKKSKCDYRFERNLSADELAEIETKVNEEIKKGHDICIEYIPYNEASRLFDLKRLPENAGENLRIVKVGDYDSCPCIGEHVKNSIEIGEFKIISTSFDNNVLRIRFKLL